MRTLACTLLMGILCALAGSVAARAQGVAASESFTVRSSDTAIFLSHEFVVPGSVQLRADSTFILASAGAYGLDARYGVILFGPSLRALLADTSRPHAITVSYNYRPLRLEREYARRRLVTLVDSSGRERQVAEDRGELTATSIFGKNFQRSGSIVRGLTVGSNRDLTLQSGLRLQFSGNITDDVEVLGALTDEETPIQPEGNTQTLREIDNVFIEIRSPHAAATLGKFIATNPAGGYASYSRKLQGAKGVARYRFGDAAITTEVVAAVAPGKFRTQQLQGRDRDQGPYRLTGEDNERNIVVVAGTEHVFVDGVPMVRGENNDYVIDYGTAEIFFQTQRPITSLSRITVDYEFSDRQYSRSFISVTNTGHLFDSTLSISASYVREADNPDATIDISLSDADRALLALAGGDRARAVRSGVYLVGRSTDSASGTYVRVDSTINGAADSVFRYDPANPAAVYNVIFSVPPDGRGDYRYVAFGQYEFVGKGLGSYLPVIYLPFPELRQIGSVTLRARPASWAAIDAELAYSDASENRFSSAPGSALRGSAFTASALAHRDSITIGGANVGAIRFGARAQYVAGTFRTVERLGEVEFNNRWNVRFRPGESAMDNFILEDSLLYLPFRALQLFASNGYLRQGGDFFSLRQEYTARFLGDTSLPSADYTFELISTDTLAGARTGRWWKQRGGLSYALGAFTPGVRFETERREDRAGLAFTDTIYPSSFRYFEAGPELRVNLPFMTAEAIARYRLEDSVRYDSVVRTRRFIADGASQTYTLRGDLRGVRNLSSSLDFTYRIKQYDSIAGVDPTGRLDNSTILARSETRWSGFDRGLDLDALYEVQTEQAARLQRLFLRVPFGQGEYGWSDIDSNGRQTEDEFRIAPAGEGEYIRYDYPTEQLYPVIDLRTTARLRLEPRRLLAAESPVGRLLAPVTSETTLRLEEKSQTEHESDIYLLRLSKFLNDSTTLLGTSSLQQDLNIFESNPEYSFRLRYLGRRGLTRLVSTVERTESFERSLRVRWQPTVDVGVQLDLASTSSLLRSTDTLSRRAFDLTNLAGTNDFSYRPEQSLELGWLLRLSSSRDVLPVVPRTTILNSNAIRAVYSIETRGRLRLEIERTNVSGRNVSGDIYSIPYQLTEGYAIGTTWVGRATFEYRFGANIQASLNYTGRAQPPSMKVIHIGTAEVRAFF